MNVWRFVVITRIKEKSVWPKSQYSWHYWLSPRFQYWECYVIKVEQSTGKRLTPELTRAEHEARKPHCKDKHKNYAIEASG
jgi:hypothetical protein